MVFNNELLYQTSKHSPANPSSYASINVNSYDDLLKEKAKHSLDCFISPCLSRIMAGGSILTQMNILGFSILSKRFTLEQMSDLGLNIVSNNPHDVSTVAFKYISLIREGVERGINQTSIQEGLNRDMKLKCTEFLLSVHGQLGSFSSIFPDDKEVKNYTLSMPITQVSPVIHSFEPSFDKKLLGNLVQKHTLPSADTNISNSKSEFNESGKKFTNFSNNLVKKKTRGVHSWFNMSIFKKNKTNKNTKNTVIESSNSTLVKSNSLAKVSSSDFFLPIEQSKSLNSDFINTNNKHGQTTIYEKDEKILNKIENSPKSSPYGEVINYLIALSISQGYRPLSPVDSKRLNSFNSIPSSNLNNKTDENNKKKDGRSKFRRFFTSKSKQINGKIIEKNK